MLLSHIKSLSDVSSSMLTWALSILGGSLLVIVNSAYYRPPLKVRLLYLVFVPAWVFGFLSIYQSNLISRRLAAAFLQGKGGEKQLDRLEKIAAKANSELGNQILFFQIMLILLAVWLTIYIIWWVFTKQEFSKQP